jgi:hypothetical protein
MVGCQVVAESQEFGHLAKYTLNSCEFSYVCLLLRSENPGAARRWALQRVAAFRRIRSVQLTEISALWNRA